MNLQRTCLATRDSLLVEEAAHAATTGDAVKLFAVTGLDRAAEVSPVSNCRRRRRGTSWSSGRSPTWSSVRPWAPPRRRLGPIR